MLSHETALLRTIGAFAAGILILGCRASAPGEVSERNALVGAGAPYSRPFEKRALPAVTASSSYGELLARAVAADPQIEAAYFAWDAAFQRAVIAGSPPDPMIGIGWMVTEPVTWMFQNILLAASQAIPNTSKISGAAREAMADARAFRVRFESLHLARRARFRELWADFDRAAREVEIAQRDVDLLGELRAPVARRLSVGAAETGDALRLESERDRADDALAAARAEVRRSAARVNAALSREPFALLDPPLPLEPLHIGASDEVLLISALAKNPTFAEAARRVMARADGVARAIAENEPDFGLEFRRQGTENMPMLFLSVPIRRDRIRAAIDEAEANFRGAAAESRAVKNDLYAEISESLTLLRESERRLRFFGSRLQPHLRAALDIQRARLSAGSGSLRDWIEIRRALLEVDRAVERARTDREKALARLLACCVLEEAAEVKS